MGWDKVNDVVTSGVEQTGGLNSLDRSVVEFEGPPARVVKKARNSMELGWRFADGVTDTV